MNQNELRTYSANIHHGIAAAFVGEKLGAHAYTAIQAPHTLTYPFRLAQPTTGNVGKALRLGRSIEAMTNTSPVRISTEQGIIMVEVPSPTPVVIQGSNLAGEGLAVPIGMSSRRAIVGVDFETDSHLLIVGATNKGKTVCSRSIVYQLIKQHDPSQVQFIVSCFKRKNWKSFSPFARIITDSNETIEMLNCARALMYKRAKDEIETPRIFIVLDDCLNLFAKDGVNEIMSELLPLARGCGINFILISQRLAGMDRKVTGNCTARIIFNVADSADSGIIGGRSDLGAENLGRYPGDCLLIANEGITRVASAYVSNEDVEALALVKKWDCTPLHHAFALVNSDFALVNGAMQGSVPKSARNGYWGDTGANEHLRVQSENLRVQTGVQTGVQRGANEELRVQSGNLRVQAFQVRLQGKPKTEDEKDFVRDTYYRLDRSITATAKAVWGSKGSNYAEYIRECLETYEEEEL